jgi:AbrB family looped-hinge helix DNA binding protein
MKKKKDGGDVVVYGTVRVSEKGQIALPVELRRDLGIEKGTQLFVLKKKGSSGFLLMGMDEVMNDIWSLHGDVFSGTKGR